MKQTNVAVGEERTWKKSRDSLARGTNEPEDYFTRKHVQTTQCYLICAEQTGNNARESSIRMKRSLLMGDFNLNLLAHSVEADRLQQTTEDSNLKQVISVSTHITNHSQILIDLQFTTNPDIFIDTGTTTLTGSDHLLIFGKCSTRIKSHPQVHTVRSFKSWVQLRSDVS